MCEYCNKKVRNKIIKDIDNDNEDKLEIVFLHNLYWLDVELEGVDPDGYKPEDFLKLIIVLCVAES